MKRLKAIYIQRHTDGTFYIECLYKPEQATVYAGEEPQAMICSIFDAFTGMTEHAAKRAAISMAGAKKAPVFEMYK